MNKTKPSKKPGVLFLGSKEYPLGTNKGDDPVTSGGIEAFVQSLAQSLARALPERVQPIIVTRRFRSTPAHEEGKVVVYRVPWMRGYLTRNLSFNFFAFLKSLSLDFDVVHAHGAVASFLGFFLSRLKGKPLVATPHGVSTGQPQYNALQNAFFSFVEGLAYSRADRVVFLSEAEKKSFKERLGFLPKNPAVIPPGVNPQEFKPCSQREKLAAKKKLGLQGKRVALFVGRLNKVKGVSFLLEAFKRLKDERAVLLVAGEGPEYHSLRMQARGVGCRVLFLGHRSNVAELLCAADAFVLPSVSEGLPTSLLEAMACGVPCVVTDVGLPVESGRDALVVPPKNPAALAKALQRVFSSGALAKRLTANALKKAKRFSVKRSAEKHVELYESVS